MTITVSAPGKLMLFGEHAVVYNRPCIVTAVGLRFYVTLEETNGNSITIDSSLENEQYKISVPDLISSSIYPDKVSFVLAAIQHLYRKYGIDKGIAVTTRGPDRSFGLGSSSAITVAIVKALSELFSLNLSTSEMFDLSYQAVLTVQKKASGFDVAAALYGGTIYFLTGGKTILPLEVGQLPIIIGYSGKKVSTVNYVAAVNSLYEKHTWAIESIFELMNQLTERAKDKFLLSDWLTLGEFANLNQGLLESLGVNTFDLAKLIFAARKAGALGAKLSGAGGGDCMYAIATPDTSALVKQSIIDAGGEIVNCDLNADGARLE